MIITEICNQYSLIRSHSRGAAYLLRWSVGLFSAWLGHPARTRDLTDEVVSSWLASLTAAAPGTRASHRTHLLTVWRWAARRGYCQPPGEVRRERAPDPQPVAWTPTEVARLLAACDQIGGPEGEYMGVLIAAGYEAGIRKGDLQGLDRSQIGEVVQLRQRKTGYAHEPRLRSETVTRILSRPGRHPLACPWGAKKYRRIWAKIRRLAGVGDTGGLQKLRRTGATWVAVEHGLDAARDFLGHRSPEMVRCYIDRRYYKPRGWLPPKAG